MFGESSSNSMDFSGGVSASRITEAWKLDLDLDYSYGKNVFKLADTTLTSIRRGKSADILVVKSIDDHWSIGGTAKISSSTYSNYDSKISIMPSIEYDIFPYSESTRRQLRILYSIGYMYNDYIEITLHDKLHEGLFAHSLMGSFEVVQKWGSIDMSMEWSNYLRNFSENNLSLNGNLSWRVAKGLSINFGGSFDFIHDRISIAKGESTPEQILLRQKQQQTSYNYFAHFGFSYTFGSIYNNVVNPRFGGGGGGMMIIMN